MALNSIIDTGTKGLTLITEESTFTFLKSRIFHKIMLIFASYNLIIILLGDTNIEIKEIDTTQLHNQLFLSLGLFATVYKISNRFIFSIYLTIFHSILQYYYIQYKKQIPISFLNKLLVKTGATSSSVNKDIITLPSPVDEKVPTLVDEKTSKLVISPLVDKITEHKIFKLPTDIFSKNKLLLYKIFVLFLFSYLITDDLFATLIIFILYFLNNHIY